MRPGSCRAWLGIPGTCMSCAGLRSWRGSTRAGRRRAPRSDPRIEQRLNADRASLIEQDLANVQAGVYPLPADHDGSLFTMLDRSWLFFRDLPDVDARRRRSATHEVLNAKTRGRLPDYYLQNFHFQSGGWLTEESADRYDTQVEVLFKGTANAMRRQCLPPLREAFAGSTSANCNSLTSAVVPAASLIYSSRYGRDCRRSASTYRTPTSGMRGAILGAGRASISSSATRKQSPYRTTATTR